MIIGQHNFLIVSTTPQLVGLEPVLVVLWRTPICAGASNLFADELYR
jgi:hypothetical protein